METMPKMVLENLTYHKWEISQRMDILKDYGTKNFQEKFQKTMMEMNSSIRLKSKRLQKQILVGQMENYLIQKQMISCTITY